MTFISEHVVDAFTHYLYAVIAIFLLESFFEYVFQFSTVFANPVLVGSVSAAATLTLLSRARAKHRKKKEPKLSQITPLWIQKTLRKGLFTNKWKKSELVILVLSLVLQGGFLFLVWPLVQGVPQPLIFVWIVGALSTGVLSEVFEKLEDRGLIDATR